MREKISTERGRISRSVSVSSDSRAPKAFNPDSMRGRLAIRAVTMNLSGQSVMGLTPAYKINYIRDYLETLPDVVFIQDGIKEEDLLPILDEVAADKYKCEYQVSFSFLLINLLRKLNINSMFIAPYQLCTLFFVR